MKHIRLFLLAIIALSSSAFADLGLGVGPFSLRFGASDDGYYSSFEPIENPLCFAISDQRQLIVLVEGVDVSNPKEKKISIKKLLVEPYAYGVTANGEPVLRGNVVKENLVKEVIIKTYDDSVQENDNPNWKQYDRGFFKGWFSSDKGKNNQTVDISKIRRIQIVEGSHFDIPKNWEGIKDPNLRVICQLPILTQTK